MVQKLPLHGQPRSCRFGGDHLLDQGQQLGQPGARQDTADPAGGSDGDWLAIKQSSAGGLEEGRAGGKGAGWEPLGRQAARGQAAGSSSPGVLAQEAAAASRYSRERALTLLLPGPLSGSRFPRRLSVHGATNLRHCNPTGPETVP